MDKDYLTGLLPLHVFFNEAQDIIRNHPEGHYAVVATDLSNFKYINDLYGMEEGDRTAQDMADMFFISNHRCLVASRPYADQFRALLDIGSVSTEEEMNIITSKNNELTKRLQQRYPNISFHVYTGLYIIEDKNEDIRLACDKAHFAKKCIKNNYSISCYAFDPKLFEDSSKIMTMTHEFQYAKTHNNIRVYYQPKHLASTGEIIGAEALGRMFSHSGEMLSPGDFIPVLEKVGIVNEFDDIIMDKTFSDLRKWISAGRKVYPVSINLSRIQFLKPGLIDKICALRDKYDIPIELIELEITETTIINSIELVEDTATKLRNMGFRIDVDDFGSGYSSLSLISTLPADTIKLDCSFARKCLNNNNQKGLSMLSSIILMLKNIGFDVICEGIETEEEKNTISNLGCDKIQGYYYGRPMPATDFEQKYIYK